MIGDGVVVEGELRLRPKLAPHSSLWAVTQAGQRRLVLQNTPCASYLNVTIPIFWSLVSLTVSLGGYQN